MKLSKKKSHKNFKTFYTMQSYKNISKKCYFNPEVGWFRIITGAWLHADKKVRNKEESENSLVT